GADDVEHHVDYPEGRARGRVGIAGRGCDDAGRVQETPRQHPRVADRASGHQVRDTGGRILPVPGYLVAAVGGRREELSRVCLGAPREGARRGDRGRGIRRARLPAHLLRRVDGGSARRREPDSSVCRVAAAGEGRRPVEAATTKIRRLRSSRKYVLVRLVTFDIIVDVVVWNALTP